VSGPTVVLIRHGSTEWSRAGRHTGRTDVPLDSDGKRQARALAGPLGKVRGRAAGRTTVLVSPLVRAVRTAELTRLAPFELDADLVEWDYGAYEGLTTAQIREQVPGWSVFTHPCPGGETHQEVAQRCDRVLERVVASGQDGTALAVLVSHGHLLRSLAARWLGRPVADGAELPLATAAVCVLGHEHGSRTLQRWNVANPIEEPLP
jgi:broad specificity phosphatase PhoE